MSVDERLISRVRSAGSVVGSVSAVGFVDPHFLVTHLVECDAELHQTLKLYQANGMFT